MAITPTGTNRAVSGNMTIEEFRKWIRRFDVNGDGRISRNELRHAIRSIGVHFSGWRSNRWIHQADANGDGFIDVEGEIDNLIDYAKSNLGINIVAV